eukprot:TRINITY_DN6958_c0_g1_i6.p1 TRINITY_DN6958_c0_g1~~TRINITY_DN6958_c0_g1_i6.p1  ORF type:complete len:588 (-),score=105.37 TRINITY_DN6958_c0_g1_i6:8-1591(-)
MSHEGHQHHPHHVHTDSAHVVPPFIGAIDQGTSSTRFILYDSTGHAVLAHQKEFEQIHPHPGWVEHDPMTIMETVTQCIHEVVEQMMTSGIGKVSDIKAVGVTNQRETTVVWDKATGKPSYNAIVWCDARTSGTVSELLEKTPNKEDKDHLRAKCGLPLSTYFSGVKLKWMLDNVQGLRQACENGTALAGTIDSWLIWNLTGGPNGGEHVTDVTNASRTMLMDLATHTWDKDLCSFMEVPHTILPTIKSSAEVYGKFADGPLKGVPLAGCLGDQQAAMVGQQCFNKGEAKNTYGTGCFMLYNTGTDPVQSTHGLLTTVCYQLGPQAPVYYALEGSIAVAGSAVKWLRDNMGIIQSARDVETLASQVKDTGGLYFVPAFSGLFAPHWRDDARGVIVGLTHHSTKSHIARATLEAVSFQTREVLDAMRKDARSDLKILKVDGGMTKNATLLQIQADLVGIPVERPADVETTAFGAAFAAGLAVGVWKEDSPPSRKGAGWAQFLPAIDEAAREARLVQWKKAVAHTLDWA